ncbi:MAG: LuxR C-terminal-related transcriptional regulator [Rikenellaceae bacterium]
MSRNIPVIAILTSNALMGIGMRSILEKMFPFAAFKICERFADIEHTTPEELFHIFVAANEVVEHGDFFELRHNKTIVLTNGTPHAQLLQNYHQINIQGTQNEIEESLSNLHKYAHGAPPTPQTPNMAQKEILSPREIDVLKLLVEGLLNKQIAERLNIGLTTVISHRKNIAEKLGIKSVAGLTMYAIMKRYIDI